MPEYLFRAKTEGDAVIQESIEATNLGQARYMLEIRGYRDVEFFSDEHSEAIARALSVDAELPEVDRELWSVEDETAALRRKGVFSKVWWAFKQHLVFFGPLFFWNWSSWRGERPFGWGDWLGFTATPLYLAFFFLLCLPMMVFDRLLEHAVWCDWRGVRRAVGQMRWLRRIGIKAIPVTELDFREAYALAANGKVDEALRLLEKYRGHPDMAEHLYLSRVSSVYEYAERYDEMIRLLEESAEKGPGGASEWIDVAMARIRRRRDVAGAREALARTTEKEIPVLASAALAICEGMIACEEKADAHAVERLNDGVGKLKEFAGNPLVQLFVAEAKAYTVVSSARLGKKKDAAQNFTAVRELLAARKETDLLARCQAALAA